MNREQIEVRLAEISGERAQIEREMSDQAEALERVRRLYNVAKAGLGEQLVGFQPYPGVFPMNGRVANYLELDLQHKKKIEESLEVQRRGRERLAALEEEETNCRKRLAEIAPPERL